MASRNKNQPTQKAPKSAGGKRAAQIARNKSARMQWLVLSGAMGAIVIGALVLISVFTEGELPVYGDYGA